MNKIVSLTKEQEDYISIFREEKRKIALNTDTIDVELAKESIRNLYTSSELKEPSTILVFQSPYQCLLERNRILEKTQKTKNSTDKTYQFNYFSGNWDQYWISLYEFAQLIGVVYEDKTKKKFEAYKKYSETCGISYLYEDIAFISDRPEHIKFDHMRRLHNEDGPALKYRDGYSVYSWHGIRVKSNVIEEKHKIKPGEILAEQNVEMRRVLTEIYAQMYGPNKLIKDLNAKQLSTDLSHERERKLYEINGEKYIHVINGSLEPDGTRREFFLGAHPDSTSPHEAVAMSYNRPTNKYKEAVRT